MVLIPNLAWEPTEEVFGRGGWEIDGWIIDECEMIDTPPPHFEARSFMNYIFFRLAALFFFWRAQGSRQGGRQGGEE
jgi:hypothetical protein